MAASMTVMVAWKRSGLTSPDKERGVEGEEKKREDCDACPY